MTIAKTMNILAVCGSLQRQSTNLELLHRAASIAPEGIDVVIYSSLRGLPHFDPDVDNAGAPASVIEWRRTLRDSDAVLIASPEYGHSLPGALKNAIDWVIGSGELYRKPVALTASVGHVGRGQRGLDAVRQTLQAVDAAIIGGQPIVRDADFDVALGALLSALVANVSSEQQD